jgi:hypothetical protein
VWFGFACPAIRTFGPGKRPDSGKDLEKTAGYYGDGCSCISIAKITPVALKMNKKIGREGVSKYFWIGNGRNVGGRAFFWVFPEIPLPSLSQVSLGSSRRTPVTPFHSG